MTEQGTGDVGRGHPWVLTRAARQVPAVPRVIGAWAAALAVPGGVLTAMAVAALLRFWAVGHQGFWYDEAVTAWLLRGSAGQMLAAIPHTESTPPLYYLVAWVWVRVFGDTEAGLRSLSALAGVATVPVAFAAGRELVGRRAGLVAGAVVAVNPLLWWYSQEARSYALLSLTTAVSLWLFARARRDPTAGRLAAWAAVGVAALCTHYFAVFVVAPQALLLLGRRGCALRARVLAVGAVVGAGVALAGLAHTQSGRIYWFTRIPLAGRIRQTAELFLQGPRASIPLLALAVAGGTVVAALLLVAFRGRPDERRGVATAAAVGGFAVVAPVLLAVAGADYVNARNVIGAVVPLAVVVAAGLGARRAGAAGLVATVALVAVSVAGIVAVLDDPGAQRPQWQRVAAALGPARRGRAVLLLGSSTWARSLGFYLPHTWWAPAGGAAVREIETVRRIRTGHECPHRTWWGASCDVAPHPALRRPPGPGFRLVDRRRVAGFAIADYRSPRPVRLYAEAPFDRRHAARRGRGHRKLLVTPTRSPVVP